MNGMKDKKPMTKSTTLSPAQIEARRKGGKTRSAQPSFKEARRKGGKTRAAQPSMQEARSKGFYATLEKHPDFVTRVLGPRMHGANRARAAAEGRSYRSVCKEIKAAAAARYTSYLTDLNIAFNRHNMLMSAPLPVGSLWG